jgi:hypothetical protein
MKNNSPPINHTLTRTIPAIAKGIFGQAAGLDRAKFIHATSPAGKGWVNCTHAHPEENPQAFPNVSLRTRPLSKTSLSVLAPHMSVCSNRSRSFKSKNKAATTAAAPPTTKHAYDTCKSTVAHSCKDAITLLLPLLVLVLVLVLLPLLFFCAAIVARPSRAQIKPAHHVL